MTGPRTRGRSRVGREGNEPPRLSPGAWRLLAHGALWLGSLAAVGWGVQRITAMAQSPPAGLDCRMEWIGVPEWLQQPTGERAMREIVEAAGVPQYANIFAPDICERVATNLRACPWVADVQRVSRRVVGWDTEQPVGIVTVHAAFREPFAFVERDNVAYLIDRHGVRLPYDYPVAAVDPVFWTAWFRVINVAGPTPSPGQVWPGADLAAALALIDYLQQAAARGEVPFRPWLTAINVQDFANVRNPLGKIRIQTVQPNTAIIWGVPIGEEADVEPNPGRKLELLRTYYVENGGRFPDGVFDARDNQTGRLWRWPATTGRGQ